MVRLHLKSIIDPELGTSQPQLVLHSIKNDTSDLLDNIRNDTSTPPQVPPWLNLNGHYCIDNLNDQSKLLTPDKNFAEKKVNM